MSLVVVQCCSNVDYPLCEVMLSSVRCLVVWMGSSLYAEEVRFLYLVEWVVCLG